MEAGLLFRGPFCICMYAMLSELMVKSCFGTTGFCYIFEFDIKPDDSKSLSLMPQHTVLVWRDFF